MILIFIAKGTFHPEIGKLLFWPLALLTAAVTRLSGLKTHRPRPERVCGSASQSSGNPNRERIFAKSSPAFFSRGDCRPPRFGFGDVTLFPPLRAQAATIFVDYFKRERTFVPPSCKLYSRTSGARFFVSCIYSPSLPAEQVCGAITTPPLRRHSLVGLIAASSW